MLHHQLQAEMNRLTPVLEHAIQTDRETFNDGIDSDLMLRMPHCGIASRALQLYMQEKFCPSAQLIENTRGLNHAVLAVDDMIIDPTYGQFMERVGLSHKVAADHNLTHLYPNPKIAVFARDDHAAFADTFTNHLVSVRSQIPGLQHNYPQKHLPPERLRMLFRATWNIDYYILHTYRPPHFEQITTRIAEQLLAA